MDDESLLLPLTMDDESLMLLVSVTPSGGLQLGTLRWNYSRFVGTIFLDDRGNTPAGVTVVVEHCIGG